MELLNYEVNGDTLVIEPIDNKKSKVYEINAEFVVNMSSLSIIKASCLFFGSSYEGRRDSAKYTMGIDMKVPIMIEDSRNILFFPTTDCIHNNSIWVSFQNLVRYKKVNNNSTMLYFKDNRQILVDIRYNLIDNQVIRCIKMDSLLKRRKEFINSNFRVADSSLN